jgi:hypothetical protein
MSRNGGAGALASRTFTVSSVLGWVTAPGNPTFSDTLNGLNQTVTATLPLDVGDGNLTAGWNITATSTSFTTGAHTLSTAATRVLTTPTVTCDGSCTLASNSVGYPYTLPAVPALQPRQSCLTLPRAAGSATRR